MLEAELFCQTKDVVRVCQPEQEKFGPSESNEFGPLSGPSGVFCDKALVL